MIRFSRLPGVVIALVAAGVASARDDETVALDDLNFPGNGGYAIQLDNDLFSGAHRDQDYSWGGGVTY